MRFPPFSVTLLSDSLTEIASRCDEAKRRIRVDARLARRPGHSAGLDGRPPQTPRTL
jgi:hypothetical protein